MKQASSQQLQKKHLIFIDYLRAFSCISVIFLHIIVSWSEGQGLTVSEYPLRLRIDTSIAEILRVAVPIFIMISGALILNKDKEITWNKIKKNTIRMILILATFGFSFALIESVMNNGLNISAITEAGRNLIEEKTWGHMWYIYMLIGLYILTPLLKAYTDKTSKQDYSNLINILTVAIIIIPSVNWLTKSHITTFYLKNQITLYVYYYLLGQYIMRYTPKKKYAIIGLALAIITLLLCGLLTDHHLTGNKYGSLPIAILAISIFSLSKEKKWKSNKLVSTIAKQSLGIYILHMFFIHFAEIVLKIQLVNTLPVVGEIAILSSITALSALSAKILKVIPVINRVI